MDWHTVLGYVGIAVVALIYAPTLYNLISKRVVAGINVRSHILWVVAGMMLFFNALFSKSVIFIILTALIAFASATIVYYGYRYKGD